MGRTAEPVPADNRSKSLQYYYKHVAPYKAKLPAKECEECGSSFQPIRSVERYCGAPCARKVANRSKHAKERARPHRIEKEGIGKYVVLKRYDWHCAICGIHTNGSTFEWNAPELDHIIPLFKGGHHLYTNIQLLCRKCNLIKDPPKRGFFRINRQATPEQTTSTFTMEELIRCNNNLNKLTINDIRG